MNLRYILKNLVRLEGCWCFVIKKQIYTLQKMLFLMLKLFFPSIYTVERLYTYVEYNISLTFNLVCKRVFNIDSSILLLSSQSIN